MVIRLGYVAISKTIENYANQHTITYTNYQKNNDETKLDNIIKNNLESLYEILKYNIKNNIHFYRISSNLIPLATKKEVTLDYIDKYTSYYQKISKIINENNIRVDMHPSNYCVLNSTKEEVINASIDILNYHYGLLNKLEIKNKLIILHVGSSTFGKKNSLSRFINNFQKLPKHLQNIIAIENDDKVFGVEDCLYLSELLNIPFVLDYHHFKCNNNGENIDNSLDRIIKTWKQNNPKMHFSSPKSQKDYRSHNDYINSKDFIEFLNILSKYHQDIDIMLEAKAKDEALFRLIRELKYQTNYHFIDETTFEI